MVQLSNWYLEKKGDGIYLAHGIVKGHPRFPDLLPIHTSAIISVKVDTDAVLIQTSNTLYFCSMKECRYLKCRDLRSQNHKNAPDGLCQWVSRLEEYIQKYEAPQWEDMPEGAILLRLGTNREYYFDSMKIRLCGDEYISVDPYVHVGMFQDSVLCMSNMGSDNCDLRYFPYKDGNLKFYGWRTDGRSVFLENVGPDPLRIEGVSGTNVYLLEPGERKEISPINASSKEKLTSKVDLYNVWDRPPLPAKMGINRDGKKFIELLDGAADGCNDTEDDKLPKGL